MHGQHARQAPLSHRQAGLLITGALRTSPTDLMELHADLAPFDLVVNRTTYRAALRIAALPVTHPLNPRAAKAAKRYVQHHRSPLHELFRSFHIVPGIIEKKPAVLHDPTWNTPFKVVIPETKEAALEIDRTDGADLRVYADGSGYEKGIGAAAVLYRGSAQPRHLQLHLGSDRQHIVYEAEVCGLLLALCLIQASHFCATATIAIDNQAAIIGAAALRPPSCLHLWQEIGARATALRQRGTRLTLRWVPGHADVVGNEMADRHAKEAAEGKSTIGNLPRTLTGALPTNVAALKAAHTKRIKAIQRSRITRDSPRYERFKDIDEEPSPKGYRALVKGLPRPMVAILTQMRLGHFPLNTYLHRIGRADADTCPACQEHRESLHHFLFQCHEHREARRSIPRRMRTYADLLASREGLPHLFRYVKKTGRFPDARLNLGIFDGEEWR